MVITGGRDIGLAVRLVVNQASQLDVRVDHVSGPVVVYQRGIRPLVAVRRGVAVVQRGDRH